MAAGGNQRIELVFGSVILPAVLNGSEAARAFARLLPLDISLRGTGVALCGALPEPLPVEPEQMHSGWRDGDINYCPEGGWLSVLVGDEENSARYGDQVTLGRLVGGWAALEGLVGEVPLRVAVSCQAGGASDEDGSAEKAPVGETPAEEGPVEGPHVESAARYGARLVTYTG